ncbi:MAG: 3-deoxy-7-phosphoheptulonate synthase [Bacteroidetes bacterium 4572_117]|nr:MAG: 3-deoxy-7-phosphoheptulonate synthase [Bacteroidetes bacterium 4572_117]
MNTNLDIIPINKWYKGLAEKPVIIAGPCSAETKEQVLQTAVEISKIPQVKIFRAGIWKPRTRPGSFEGVGTIGLKWLAKVKQKTKLLTAVEVATPEHVKICKQNPESVDILWIGARTTANPFSVQELADALKGLDIPVMIKNPINPDLSLWIGAIERVYNSGINKIAAIHRGFSPFEPTKLRNIPKWEIPIDLKLHFPKLDIINDPSHISGIKKYVSEIAQDALDLNMDGLMIETHINPEKALSDAKQQLKPEELAVLLERIKYRLAENKNPEFISNLEQFRYQIDSIDQQIIELLAHRMLVIEDIGAYKADNNVTIFQLKRWKKIISSRLQLAKDNNVDQNFMRKLLQLVHKESIRKQKNVLKLKNASK